MKRFIMPDVDAPVHRGYLESMILLSEAAEKIRNEISSWPGYGNRAPVFHYASGLNDAREGDERLLSEVLSIALGLVSPKGKGTEVTISGDDSRIHLALTGTVTGRSSGNADWDSLTVKAAGWTPEIIVGDGTVDLILYIPSSSLDPPVDIVAMAGETGLDRQDAMMILGGFVEKGRVHLERLRNSDSGTDRFRAAHSLKGAGKTLRAAELAAAARVVEKDLRENRVPDISGVENAWNRIEGWYREAGR